MYAKPLAPRRRCRKLNPGLGGAKQISTRFDTDAKRGLTLISPTAIYVLLLLAVPLATIVAFSFWSQDFLSIDRTLTLKNYREAFTDPIYRVFLLRSLWISGVVTVVTVVLAFPIAYFVSFHVPPERKALWIFLITIPFWTSYLLRAFLWKVILGFNGVLNSGLLGLGLIDEPLTFILYNTNAVVITLAHAFAPFTILPIYVALEKIDRSLLEASQDLGEGTARTFFRVTLPLAMPGVVAATLIVFIPTIGDYVTPRLVGGPDGLMIANMIQTQFLKLNNAPMGAALSVLAMGAVTLISLIFLFANRRFLK
ncbi:spermidine/putrescine transport system permease protein [Litoreibacter meonggei]|uniref:Spermidine/putrescine transport system permease protein n=1 Tax=Litoreibacter meonggei TaxID=1049199 RepID=A0A497X559_9RHOB|nr:ABC transporter permease [Litoreibacter meonggei]RLJ60233.1 spermidine/putrescine transport system permease protein [Litoreibacter meonggei]